MDYYNHYSAPIYDNDNMSSLSFNSRLIDQFRNLGDSVSQIGNDPQYLQEFDLSGGAGGLDLGQV